MFGKKRKKAQYAALAEQRRLEEQQQRLAASQRDSQPTAPQPSPVKPPEKVYLASEIILDEPVLEPIEELVLVEIPEEADAVEEVVEAKKKDDLHEARSNELASDVVDETYRPAQKESGTKPAKLAQLPLLIDFMLSMNLSRSIKMNFASLLLMQYNKYKDVPEEKAILVECLKKLIADIAQA